MKITHTIGAALMAATLGVSGFCVYADDGEPRVEAKLSSEPCSKGYLDVNGLQLYHEIYGESRGDEAPLVLLHGGLMTIPEMQPWIEPLAKTRKVVALELQGHGRTADTDRPLALSTIGDDVAEVIDQLELGQADVAGYSFGADVALRTAIQHPDKVRRLVVISTPYALRGWYPEAQKGMADVDASLAEALKDTPTAKFAAAWPQPERFPKLLDKMGDMMGESYDWGEDVKKLPMPVLLVYADHDSVSQQHIADFYALLGGGITEPGWQNTKFTRARLAIIPGYSHYNFISSPEVAYTVAKYLRDPLDGTAGGAAAAASQSAP
jgi:pimeloyl-ACP methyl ester carboxylesterase